MSVTHCGICGKEMATVCASCHVKDVEDLNQKIEALEERLEEAERRIRVNASKIQRG